MKFVSPGGQFDVEAFRHGVDTLIVSSGNPGRQRGCTRPKRSRRTRHDYRPLGLGFANLGALLMSFSGIPV